MLAASWPNATQENKEHLNIHIARCWKACIFAGCSSGSEAAHLRPRVHHIHEVAAGVGPQDGLQHLLVLQAAGAEARQGLAAAADGSLGRGRNNFT